MLEFKHVALDKRVLDLLVCPCDEQLIVVCCLQKQQHTSLSLHNSISTL